MTSNEIREKLARKTTWKTRVNWKSCGENTAPEEPTVLNVIKTQQNLFQENPDLYSPPYKKIYKIRSPTHSLESRQNYAKKQLEILLQNGRIPTMEIIIHFVQEYEAEEIKTLRPKMFRYLKEHGIEAITNIEGTKDGQGRNTGRVHLHILTDDPRSKKELRALFNTACRRQRLVRGTDFLIQCRKLTDGKKYFAYFVKFGHEDALFHKGLRIKKFPWIGKWFRKTKSELWKEYVDEMKKKYGTDKNE